jgi:hypothetical protein
MTDTELKIKAYEILSSQLGLVEMEKFISLVQLDKFDYTRWRNDLFSNKSGEEISKMAMEERRKKA